MSPPLPFWEGGEFGPNSPPYTPYRGGLYITIVQEVETKTDETNYALWGGLAAVTAGITAIALSRRA